MATTEQIERIAALLREAHPGMALKKVNESTEGLGAVLMFLADAEGPVSAGAVSAFLHVSTARVAVLTRKLEAKGLIVTGGRASDARVTSLRLSETGREASRQLREELHEQIGYLADRLGAERLTEFARTAGEIQRALAERTNTDKRGT